MSGGVSGGPRVAVADGFAQLVAHVFAHVALDQPGNLYDRRYVAWAREHLPAQTSSTVEHDAALIGRHWRDDRRLDVLHAMFELHRNLDGFRRTAARALAELAQHEVRSAHLLTALRDEAIAPVAELLHTTLAVIADDFAAVLGCIAPLLAHDCARLQPRLQRIAAALPGFESARIELVWALGVHGRAFPDRILVGAPTDWSDCSLERQAVLAAHEWCVRASVADDYLGSEWDALTTLARHMQHVRGLALVDAHAQWLASLDLDELLRGVVARGWLAHDDARALLDDPGSRANRLAVPSLQEKTAWTCNTPSSPGTPKRSGNP